MEWIEEYDLFLLDFDGLLVNTERVHYQAYQQVVQEMGQSKGIELSWSFEQYCAIAHSNSTALSQAVISILHE